MHPRLALVVVLAALALASLIRADDGASTVEPKRPYRSLRRGLQDNDAPDPLENEFEQQNAAPPQARSDEDGDSDDRRAPSEHRRKRIRHGFKGSRDTDEDSKSGTGDEGQDGRGPLRDDDAPPARNIPGDDSRGDRIVDENDRAPRLIPGPSGSSEPQDSNDDRQARPNELPVGRPEVSLACTVRFSTARNAVCTPRHPYLAPAACLHAIASVPQ